MQWPFLNKVPALPHFMTFKASHEDKPKRVVGADAFEPSPKRPTGEVQVCYDPRLYISNVLFGHLYKNLTFW